MGGGGGGGGILDGGRKTKRTQINGSIYSVSNHWCMRDKQVVKLYVSRMINAFTLMAN